MCPGAGGSHRGLTEMDGPVTGGDKPAAGGNIEADNKERTRNRGAGGARRWRGRASSSRARWRRRSEDKGSRSQSLERAPVPGPYAVVGPSVAWASPALYSHPALPQNTEPPWHSLLAKGLVRDPKSPYPPGTSHQALGIHPELPPHPHPDRVDHSLLPWRHPARVNGPKMQLLIHLRPKGGAEVSMESWPTAVPLRLCLGKAGFGEPRAARQPLRGREVAGT